MARRRQQKDRAEPARAHSDSYRHSASSSASELTPTATPLPTLLTSRSLPPWPVPSHCEGTPAIPLSPFPSWPVPSHCEGTSAFPLSPCLPGPFLPIATEPRPSRFLLFFLARSLPLRGNPGLPGFSLRPGSFLPAVREPRPSRFPFTLLSFAPNRKSQQRPGPTGTTVSTSRALLRHPPGTLLQVTDTVPERFRRHQVPTPLFVHIVNKGPPVATPACFATPFPRPDSRPPDTVRSAKLPWPGVPPQPQKETGARGIPRPTRTASNPVTSLL
jgi:hypothetical protein